MGFKKIPLTGKYAKGKYAFALVDDEEFDRVISYKWKAKWNAANNYVYAVRNVIVDGRNTMIRMHRDIMGIGQGDYRVVDHLNHNTLDNRKQNLRICSQRENMRNIRIEKRRLICTNCDVENDIIDNVIALSLRCRNGFVCDECKKENRKQNRIKKERQKEEKNCMWCGEVFLSTRTGHKFCCSACRSDYKYNANSQGRNRRGPYNTLRRDIRARALERIEKQCD